MKKVNYLILLITILLVMGCGAGGGGFDSYQESNNTNNPVVEVESEFRNVSLEWLPNSEPNLAGYRVFMRRDGLDYDYTNPEWETTDTDCTLYNLYKDTTYYFVVRAFDTNGNESGDSNEAILERI